MSSSTLLVNIDRFGKNDPFYTSVYLKICPFSLHPSEPLKVGCVVTVPKFIFEIVNSLKVAGGKRKEFVNSRKFISSISKKGLVIFSPKKKVCSLINCFGSLTDTIHCLQSQFHITPDTTLWVSCDLKDRNLKQKVKEMLLTGFTSPYICTSNPFSKSHSPSLCMYKQCNQKSCPIISIQNVIYVLHEYMKSQPFCSLSLTFDPKTVTFLKSLCFSGKSKNKDGSVTQKEMAGSLYLDQVDHKIKVNRKSITLGEEHGIELENATYNFHSHPLEAYDHFNTRLAWPSCHDYKGFLDSYLDTGTILHVVVAIEGVYVVSIKKEFVNSKSILLKLKKNNKILKNFKIPFNNASSPQQYLNIIQNIPDNIFDVSFHNWQDLLNGSKITVAFNRIGHNCFTDLDVLQIIKRLHTLPF